MNITLSIFSSICLLLCLLATYILFFKNKEQIFSNRLLAVVLFILALTNFNILIFYSRLLIQMPFLYRMYNPISLLLLPFCYFYVRSILNPEIGFHKLDSLVLLPSILCIVNFWPVYTLPQEQKLVLVANLLNDVKLQSQFRDGFLPPYLFSFIRIIWSGIFVLLQFRLIRKFQKNIDNEIVKVNAVLLQWLTLFSKLFLGLLLIYIVVGVVTPILKIGTSFTDIALQTLVLIITLKLFLQPQILYGIYIPSEKFKSVVGSSKSKSNEIHEVFSVTNQNSELKEVIQRNSEYKEKIDYYFKKHQPFLNPDYTLSHLVIALDIPQHKLSSFINQEYGMGFRKFINEKRVAYILENSKKPEWKNLTLEAISMESGFGNRSTFIKNFKEVTGKNPLQYFKNDNV